METQHDTLDTAVLPLLLFACTAWRLARVCVFVSTGIFDFCEN